MKKFFKITGFIFALFIILGLGIFLYGFSVTYDVKLDNSKLVNLEKSVLIYDKDGVLIDNQANSLTVTPISDLPSYVINAFISVEDKRFYSHKGIDVKGVIRAFFNNVKSLSFKEGASTISQQLIKNTHLSNEKTIKRKLAESKLAIILEKNYSKEEIMEMYLNTIYFGDNCYGITEASNRYFDKMPYNLTVGESAVLAGLIKAPNTYSPTKNKDNCIKRRNVVLKEMFNQNYISENEYEKALKEDLSISNESLYKYNYTYLVSEELNEILTEKNIYGRKLKVYSYFDAKMQSFAENSLSKDEENCDKTILISNKNNQIISYVSTSGNINRQMGSTVKPFIYASALETDYISPLSVINDEKTDFNGYSPKNYGNKYIGKISCETALSKSSNVCAVKILNQVGVDKTLSFLKKTDIPFTKEDNSLVLALGCTEKGAKLSEISSAYTTFLNDGNYKKCKTIDKITDENGNILYKNVDNYKRIFSLDTTFLLNTMTKQVVENGTLSKLKNLDYNICGKTGTVGNDNGNTDAYTVSYNPEYVVSVWFGNKNNELLKNSITGGKNPADISYDIWSNISKIKDKSEFSMPYSVSKILLDKVSYDNDYSLEIANGNVPTNETVGGYFKNKNVPKTISKRFVNIEIEKPKIIENINGFYISLCLPQYYEAKILRYDGNKKTVLYDTVNDCKDGYLDEDIVLGKTYDYYVIPYYKNNEGKEVFIGRVKKDFIDLENDI